MNTIIIMHVNISIHVFQINLLQVSSSIKQDERNEEDKPKLTK